GWGRRSGARSCRRGSACAGSWPVPPLPDPELAVALADRPLVGRDRRLPGEVAHRLGLAAGRADGEGRGAFAAREPRERGRREALRDVGNQLPIGAICHRLLVGRVAFDRAARAEHRAEDLVARPGLRDQLRELRDVEQLLDFSVALHHLVDQDRSGALGVLVDLVLDGGSLLRPDVTEVLAVREGAHFSPSFFGGSGCGYGLLTYGL